MWGHRIGWLSRECDGSGAFPSDTTQDRTCRSPHYRTCGEKKLKKKFGPFSSLFDPFPRASFPRTKTIFSSGPVQTDRPRSSLKPAFFLHRNFYFSMFIRKKTPPRKKKTHIYHTFTTRAHTCGCAVDLPHVRLCRVASLPFDAGSPYHPRPF
jgi:hypothetical protein